jgi:hypothetical protein
MASAATAVGVDKASLPLPPSATGRSRGKAGARSRDLRLPFAIARSSTSTVPRLRVRRQGFSRLRFDTRQASRGDTESRRNSDATFQAFMARQDFEVRHYASTVKGMLDETPDGIVFTSIVIEVAFETPAERVDEATRLLEAAKRHCIVSNALRTPVDLRVSTTVACRLGRAASRSPSCRSGSTKTRRGAAPWPRPDQLSGVPL